MLEVTAKDLASVLGGILEGNGDQKISAIAKIEEGQANALSFISNPKYEHFAATATAGVLLANKTLPVTSPHIHAVIRVEDPYSAFTQLLEMYQQMMQAQQSGALSGIDGQSKQEENCKIGTDVYVGAFTYLGKNVVLGNNVKIYPNCFIGNNTEIGDNTVIYAGVNIYHETKIGKNCIVHSGVVIGSDGFGFAPLEDGSWKKIPQTGNVVIGNHVEIGANTCIDRATMGSTVIHDGVKLDNLIQIAHNVEIGEHTAIAALVGISGSAKLGKKMLVGGQTGISGHIKLADGTKIQAKAAVIKDVEKENTGLSGIPAVEGREHYRQLAAIKQLPDLIKRIAALEKELATQNK